MIKNCQQKSLYNVIWYNICLEAQNQSTHDTNKRKKANMFVSKNDQRVSFQNKKNLSIKQNQRTAEGLEYF